RDPPVDDHRERSLVEVARAVVERDHRPALAGDRPIDPDRAAALGHDRHLVGEHPGVRLDLRTARTHPVVQQHDGVPWAEPAREPGREGGRFHGPSNERPGGAHAATLARRPPRRPRPTTTFGGIATRTRRNGSTCARCRAMMPRFPTEEYPAMNRAVN